MHWERIKVLLETFKEISNVKTEYLYSLNRNSAANYEMKPPKKLLCGLKVKQKNANGFPKQFFILNIQTHVISNMYTVLVPTSESK